jgi:hypothetical protein
MPVPGEAKFSQAGFQGYPCLKEILKARFKIQDKYVDV